MIVDDEASSIQVVSGLLDWASLGIEQVFTAQSVRQAKEYILQNPIDILLCDIEMPQESGLDLLEWVNREKKDISCIYMTSFAEFSYAQRAVKLGSLAYLLKPVDAGELRRELTAAIEKRHEMQRMRSAERSLQDAQGEICSKFWQNLFYEDIPSERTAIARQIENLRLPLDMDWLYCPVLLVIRDWGQGDREGEQHRVSRYGARNVAMELLDNTARSASRWYTILPFGNNAQLALCGGEDGAALKRCCTAFAQSYLKEEQTWLTIRTVCYVGRPMPIERTAEEIELLLRTDNNWLQNQGLVIPSEMGQSVRTETDIFNKFERWTDVLEEGRFAQVRQEIVQYLRDQEGNAWFTRWRFRYFLSSYAAMLSRFAEGHQFPLRQLLEDPEVAACFEHSDQGLDTMRAWVERSLGEIERRLGQRSGDPVTATKAYIDAHLAEEVSLNEIADNVHLNLDYLNRIFKRETGDSVRGYMVTRRMTRAKELLMNTRMPIADVAYQVGYNNYISFNRNFKKAFGVSPQSFRQGGDSGARG